MASQTRPSSGEDADPAIQLLLVDDDEVVRARFEGLLSQLKFDVYSVGSAREARLFMATLVCPIVLIDRMLGDADGIVLVSELRQQYSAHRVFLALFTSLDSDEERARGLAAGADAYISKRASDRELITLLTEARSVVKMRGH